jgi:hypothetical protein
VEADVPVAVHDVKIVLETWIINDQKYNRFSKFNNGIRVHFFNDIGHKNSDFISIAISYSGYRNRRRVKIMARAYSMFITFHGYIPPKTAGCGMTLQHENSVFVSGEMTSQSPLHFPSVGAVNNFNAIIFSYNVMNDKNMGCYR